MIIITIQTKKESLLVPPQAYDYGCLIQIIAI